jgi:hypothetical protein
MSILVTIERAVVSSVPGHTGNWAIRTTRAVDAVPRSGDDVVLADGWASAFVKRVSVGHDGRVTVILEPCRTDSPETLGEIGVLVRDHGWEQMGGPWTGQLQPA